MTHLYFPATWVVVCAGIVPAVWFLATCRPTRWHRAQQIDASSWVVMVLGFYVLSLVALIAGVHAPSPVVGGLTLAWRSFADAVLWYRALRWRAVRATLNEPPKRRATDQPALDTTGQE